MSFPRIYADFHNADPQGRVRLNSVGTIRDLGMQGISLESGLRLTLSDDELETMGKVVFSDNEQIWVATIDWNRLQDCDSDKHSEPSSPLHADEPIAISSPGLVPSSS